MNDKQQQKIFAKIDALTQNNKRLWGQMNVNQMVCHCADQVRIALGTKTSLAYSQADLDEIIRIAQSRQSLPTPEGIDQVKGERTLPVNLENDKETLKRLILEFSQTNETFIFSPHPYFGLVDKKQWTNLIINHIDHHFGQFGV